MTDTIAGSSYLNRPTRSLAEARYQKHCDEALIAVTGALNSLRLGRSLDTVEEQLDRAAGHIEAMRKIEDGGGQ